VKTISINHIEFTIDTTKHEQYWSFISSGKWEPRTFKVIDYFLKKGDTVLDIGAWAGPLSLYMSVKAKDVYAIEPDPEIFSELQNNVSLNAPNSLNIHPIKKAISSSNEQTRLFARKKYGQSSTSILKRTYDHIDHEKCETITLETLIKTYEIAQLDFLKIDVEGAEYDFIPGISEKLNALNHPTVLLSFHTSQLNQSLALTRFKTQFLAKLLLKIFPSFHHKKIKSSTISVIESFKNYNYVYFDNGLETSIKELTLDPLKTKDRSIIFSNVKWHS